MRRQGILIRTLVLAGLLLAISLAAVAADISGTWGTVVQLANGNAGSVTFTFQQNGEKLTGTYKGALGEAPLTGTVKGEEVGFTVELERGERKAKIEYTGKIISATSMKGDAQYPQIGSATWTATKK